VGHIYLRKSLERLEKNMDSPGQPLREDCSLPCSQITRQRSKSARQSLCRAVLHGKERSATFGSAKGSSPCVSRKLPGKPFAERSTFAVRRAVYAVHDSIAVRHRPLPCAARQIRTAKAWLCRALLLPPHGKD
jgi:hypothetical protein